MEGLSVTESFLWLSIAITLTVMLVGQSWIRLRGIPPSLKWAGRRNEIFPMARACLREYTAGVETLIASYTKFSKNGQLFISPAPGFQPQVMLPKEYIRWLVDQPEGVLSQRKVQGQRLALDYMFPFFDFTNDKVIIEAIRLHLTRRLGKIQGDLVREIQWAVDDTLGVDQESWREVKLCSALQEILFGSSSSILMGKTLSHNQRFMKYLLRFSTFFGAGTLVIGQLVPGMFRRLVSPLIAIPANYYRLLCDSYVWPLLNERFRDIEQSRRDPTFDYNPPDDMITYLVRAALDRKETSREARKSMMSMLTILVGGGMASSVLPAANTLLDLLSSDPKLGYYRLLREEAESVFLTEADWSKPARLLKLRCTDSAIRESMRRNTTLARALWREVMPKDGVTLPNGQHLQQGCWIAVPVSGIHVDERFYPEPDVYNPLRFVSAEVANDPAASQPRKPPMMATTTDTFLPFGHGRHSCPGRWFASHVLKLALAYITMHYDIQPLEMRPLNVVHGDTIVPPMQATIRLRRRKIM